MRGRDSAALRMIVSTPFGRDPSKSYSAILYMIKYPTETDFEVRTSETAVEVFFRPTFSYYTFNRFADRKDIAEFGPLSPDPRLRHASPSGDTGNYPATEVLAMAFRMALEAAMRK